MDTAQRRKEILKKLNSSEKPITGSKLSQIFGVSRQVIVQDIAILRASGKEIIATPNGYMLNKIINKNVVKKTYAVKHDPEDLEKELLIFVDCGGTVIDVVVEHAFYGEIKGFLMFKCREDVYDFLNKIKKTESKPLSSLTQGIHLHTVEAETEEVHQKITEKLKNAGILLESDIL